MGRTLSQEARDALYPDPNKQKLQRSKDIFAAANNGGIIQPTPYELASGAKTPTSAASTDGKKAVAYDETSFRNPQIKARGADTPRIGAKLGPGLTLTQDGQGTVSMFNADGTKADPSKARLSGGNLGGTPLPAGQSPFFMKSEAAKTLVPQPGTASAIPGMQQSPAVTMPGGNWTGMLNQDDAIFKAQMANVGQDYRIGTGNPAFASDPMMAQSLARRDSLQASLDTFNRQNPLRPGASVGEIISNRAATAAQRKELEALNADIFGRSDLGTKLQMAILDSLTKKGIAAGENQTALAKQGLENEGQFATRSMMEGNENLRHAASLRAGVGQPKPGEDPFAKVGPNAIQEVLKAQLAANPNMTIEDITSLVNNLSTRLSGKPGGQLKSVLETIKN